MLDRRNRNGWCHRFLLMILAAYVCACGAGGGGAAAPEAPRTDETGGGRDDSSPGPNGTGKEIRPFAATLSHKVASIGEKVTCNGVPENAVEVVYEWYLRDPSGQETRLVAETAPNLVVTRAAAHSFLSCVIVAKDGEKRSVRSTKAPYIAVINTAPAAFKPKVTPSEGLVTDVFTCTAASADDDLDEVRLSYRWEVLSLMDGRKVRSMIPGATSESFRPSKKDTGREIVCVATATDALGRATDGVSDVVRIKNKAPNPFAAYLSASSGYVGDKVSCSGATTDDDSEGPLSYAYIWSRALTPDGPYSRIEGAEGSSYQISQGDAHRCVRCDIVARDAQGGETLSSTIQSFAVENSAPRPFTASLKNSPTAAKAGDTLTCAGTALDPDGDELSYATVWESGPSAAGPWDTLSGEEGGRDKKVMASERGLYVRCRIVATDPLGSSVGASPSVAVQVLNQPPVKITPVIPEGDVRVGRSLSCDATPEDPDGDVILSKIYWEKSRSAGGPFVRLTKGDGSDYEGRVLAVGPSLSHLYLRCLYVMDDLRGGVTESNPSAVVSILNTPPSPFSASVSAAAAGVGDTISCSGATSDDDQDPRTYSYVWEYVVGATHTPTGDTAASLTISPRHAHKTLRCTMLADDGQGGLTVSSPSGDVSVLNTPPGAFASFLPATGYVSETVSCGGEAEDIDDDALSYTYRWEASRDGDPFVVVPGETARELTITKAMASHGELRCAALADDGHGGASNSVMSAPMAVLNARPLPFSAEISGAEGGVSVSSVLSCEGEAEDPDGDSLNHEIIWESSSTPNFDEGTYAAIGGLDPASRELTVPASVSHRHLRCLVRASDDSGLFTLSSPSPAVYVENTAPSPFAASSTPSARVGDTVSCTGTTADIDADTLSYAFAWYVSDTAEGEIGGAYQPLPGGRRSSFRATSTIAHKWLRCTIVASDGHGGSYLTPASSPTEIANTSPLDFPAQMEPAAGVRVFDTASCRGETVDPDDDPITYTAFRFYADAGDGTWEMVQDGPSSEYEVTSHVAHRRLRCEIQAEDDFGGVTVSSASPIVPYLNTPPAPFYAGISPATTVMGDTVSCAGTTSDDDGDTLTHRSLWYVAPTPAGPWSEQLGPRFAGDTITITTAEAHRWIACRREASDGHGGMTTTDLSDSSRVKNTAPVLSLISDLALTEGASVSIDLRPYATDADGDALVFSCPGCPPGASVTGYTLSYTPPYSEASRQSPVRVRSVTIEVDDQNGGRASTDFSASIANKVRLPSVSITSCPLYMDEASASDVSYRIDDPDGNPVTVELAPTTAISTTNPLLLAGKTIASYGAQTVTPAAGGATVTTGTVSITPHWDEVAHSPVAKPAGGWKANRTVVLRVGYADGAAYGQIPSEVTATCETTVRDTDRPAMFTASCLTGSAAETSTRYIDYIYSDPDGDPVSVTTSGSSLTNGTVTQDSANSRLAIGGSYTTVSHSMSWDGTNFYRDVSGYSIDWSNPAGQTGSVSCTGSFRWTDVDRPPVFTNSLNYPTVGYYSDPNTQKCFKKTGGSWFPLPLQLSAMDNSVIKSRFSGASDPDGDSVSYTISSVSCTTDDANRIDDGGYYWYPLIVTYNISAKARSLTASGTHTFRYCYTGYYYTGYPGGWAQFQKDVCGDSAAPSGDYAHGSWHYWRDLSFP